MDSWETITSDPAILCSVTGYKIPFISRVTQKSAPAEPNLKSDERAAHRKAIRDLLDKGAISRCSPEKEQFLSKYFLRKKSNGEDRFILNLKKLNRFIEAPHFKLEDIKTALKLITRGSYMATIDLKDSYFLVPIHRNYKKFLRFEFENRIYEFNVLPFGLSTAPYVFTKLLKPIAQKLRSAGFNSVIYLDDILMIAENKKDCAENVKITREMLQSLGFVINTNKSQLNPARQCKFLGFILDTEDFSIYLPKNKREDIRKIICTIYNQNNASIRSVAKMIGALVAACPAVSYGWLYTKRIEREKFLALSVNADDFDREMKISGTMRRDLEWWLQNLKTAKNPIKENKYVLEIFTDASLTGWGAYCHGDKARGWWNDTEKEGHINLLELRAALNGLKCFARGKRNCEILLRIDNTTAIAYVNRMGGIQFPKLNNLAREIWQWCETKNIHIFASYINTKDNKIADAESRALPPETEWELADWAFDIIVDELGRPTVDLFASSMNAKCDKFVSWHRDPNSIAIDAFTIRWSNEYFYAFPPFSMILRVLQKIVTDRAEGIVVVPLWPTQPWFPRFKSLAKTPFIEIGPNHNLLSSISRQEHPLSTTLTLVAAKLSGKHT